MTETRRRSVYKYNHSEKNRANQKRYRAKGKDKEACDRYRFSEAGAMMRNIYESLPAVKAARKFRALSRRGRV